MGRTSLLCVVALISLEACTASAPRKSAFSAEQLLSGASLSWQGASTPAVIRPAEVVALDDDMRSFVAPLRAIADPIGRLNGLRQAMGKRGLFSIVYNNTETRTVRETFHARQGNCLSFTMLFVALARELKLDARYQLVDVPPTFRGEGGLLVVDTHVNAVVHASLGRTFVVDFNAASFNKKYPTHPIADRDAIALYYNNVGAEALIREEYAESFALLREAARTQRDIADVWVNLGVLYSREEQSDYAEAAYLRALEVDPGQSSAMVNLVSIYSARGETALADEYEQRIRRYREINPYYHFDVARAAFEEERFEDALAALRSAIRLKHDDEDFYELRGRVLQELGRADKASASFERARELAAAGH